MTAKMHYAVLHNFDTPLFATHFLCHEKKHKEFKQYSNLK